MNALQAEVVKLVAEYFRKATIRFGREFPEYTVCFDLGKNCRYCGMASSGDVRHG